MLKRPVLVRGLVLLVRHRPVPVVLKPHLQQLHLVRGGEAGHLIADVLHELPGGPVRPKRSSLLHQLPERADLGLRLRLVIRLLLTIVAIAAPVPVLVLVLVLALVLEHILEHTRQR